MFLKIDVSKLHIERSYIASCEGLASFDIIDYLGLQQSKKSLIISFVTVDNFKKVKRNLINRLDIDRPGNGVVFICPLSSFGGKRELNLCLQGQKISERKDTMKDNKYELIVTIANSGYSNTIMTSARKNGAKGGTLIHGKSNEPSNVVFTANKIMEERGLDEETFLAQINKNYDDLFKL